MLPRSAIHISRITWDHRDLVSDLIKRDFKLRYVGSLLGSWWNVVHPLVMIAIYTLIFSLMMKAKLSGVGGDHKYAYTVYLCAGLLPWNAFVEMVSRGTSVFVDNANLIKKVSFPTETLMPIIAGTSTITFLIAIALYLGVIGLVQFGLGPQIILLPFAFFLQLVFATGLSLVFAVLTVFFRDIQQLVMVIFNIWFWLTPIVYAREIIPEKFTIFMLSNPMFYYTNLYQKAFYYKTWPSWWEYAVPTALSFITFALGASFFCHFKPDLPDEL